MFEALKNLLSKNKKLIISLGIVPVALITASTVKTIADKRKRAPKLAAEPEWELASLEKIIAIKEVRSHLADFEEEQFSIEFGRNKKVGNWGYYIRNRRKNWIFVCCSDEFEKAHLRTPYWIELDDELSLDVLRKGLEEKYSFYPHPSIKRRLLIAVSPEDMKNPKKTANTVSDIAKVLLTESGGKNT